MSDDGVSPDGGVTTEVRGRILLMGIDRPTKMNGFTPRMMAMLVDAYTRLDEDDDLCDGEGWAEVADGSDQLVTRGGGGANESEPYNPA